MQKLLTLTICSGPSWSHNGGSPDRRSPTPVNMALILPHKRKASGWDNYVVLILQLRACDCYHHGRTILRLNNKTHLLLVCTLGYIVDCTISTALCTLILQTTKIRAQILNRFSFFFLHQLCKLLISIKAFCKAYFTSLFCCKL